MIVDLFCLMDISPCLLKIQLCFTSITGVILPNHFSKLHFFLASQNGDAYFINSFRLLC